MVAKPGMRDSLVNMLGEFVGLSKNPEFRLSTSSEQFLADAIKEEKKASTCSTTSSIINIYIGMDPISHQRSNSTPIRRNAPKKSSATHEASSSRRLSMPLLRPKSLLKRFQQRHSGSYDPNPMLPNLANSRHNSIISESDEEVILAELPKPKQRTRNSSQSSSILGDLAKSGHIRCQPLLVPIH